MSGNAGQNVSQILGIEFPDDFEIAPYEATHVLVTEANPGSYGEFLSAWMAVGYRFRACAEHDQAFTSVRQFRHSTSPPEKYIEERELFGFFVTGQAVLESYIYAMYAVGAIIEPAEFPIASGSDLRRIGPSAKTINRFRKAFPNDDISNHLHALITSPEFDEWSTVRNILAHRLVPSRIEEIGNNPTGKYHTWWGNSKYHTWPGSIVLDANTTADRRKWLAARVKELLVAADDLTKRLWPNYRDGSQQPNEPDVC